MTELSLAALIREIETHAGRGLGGLAISAEDWVRLRREVYPEPKMVLTSLRHRPSFVLRAVAIMPSELTESVMLASAEDCLVIELS